MKNVVLEAININKTYNEHLVLNNLNFTIEKGKITALLGPNGSGKTTFFKIVSNHIEADSGKILINNKDLTIDTKSQLAFLPDENHFYKWMTVKDGINFYNDFFEDFVYEYAVETIEKMNLKNNQMIRNLSKGSLEKFRVILTMARKTDLYILDEPFTGVDIISLKEILDMILDGFEEKRSIIISTHAIRDIEILFDDVLMIRDGKIIMKGECECIRYEKGKSIEEVYIELFK